MCRSPGFYVCLQPDVGFAEFGYGVGEAFGVDDLGAPASRDAEHRANLVGADDGRQLVGHVGSVVESVQKC